MSCHESLMARRRKRSRGTTSAAKTPSASQSPMFLDKSLPPPPPGVMPPPPPPPPPPVSTTSDRDRGTSPSEIYTETPTELSPRPPLQDVRRDSSRSLKRDRSGLTPDIKQKGTLGSFKLPHLPPEFPPPPGGPGVEYTISIPIPCRAHAFVVVSCKGRRREQ